MTSQKEKEKDNHEKYVKNKTTTILVLVVIAFLCLGLPFTINSGYFTFLFLFSGLGLLVVVCVTAFQFLLASEKKLKKDFRRNRKGVVWLWFVAGLTIAFMSFVWWALTWPLTSFIEKAMSVFVFPYEVTPFITLFTNIILWFPFFVCVVTLIWVIVNSQRREIPY